MSRDQIGTLLSDADTNGIAREMFLPPEDQHSTICSNQKSDTVQPQAGGAELGAGAECHGHP